MLHSNAIVNTPDMRNYIGNSDTSVESQIELAINIVSSAFDSHVGYQIIGKNYSNIVLNGSGERLLRFPANNVTGCTSIEYRSSTTSWRSLPEYLYELDSIHQRGVVGTGSFFFSSGVQNWRACFTAGWERDNVPGIIVEAFLFEVKRFLELRPDIVSENLGGQSMSGRTYSDLRKDTERKLM